MTSPGGLAIVRVALETGAQVSEKIGFIGVGRMGSGMVSRLLAAGHQVFVHDPDPRAVAAIVAKGAVASASAADVAASASVVMASVPTPAIAKATGSAGKENANG